jgi:hypothetical protein
MYHDSISRVLGRWFPQSTYETRDLSKWLLSHILRHFVLFTSKIKHVKFVGNAFFSQNHLDVFGRTQVSTIQLDGHCDRGELSWTIPARRYGSHRSKGKVGRWVALAKCVYNAVVISALICKDRTTVVLSNFELSNFELSHLRLSHFRT